ncbi:hypothetical protein BC835DRAFT_506221 [Cytidiella melzeri]|nr:hypothetical protein BC835DRAFT_506221 [Cytidiella melzeri]
MLTQYAPHQHRAAASRYRPYQSSQRPSSTQCHVRRLVTRRSPSSVSPLDSPQLLTPPDPHPHSMTPTGSEAKRGYYSASHTIPYAIVDSDNKYDTTADAPLHAFGARQLIRGSLSHIPLAGKDLGDGLMRISPPLHMGLLQELDSNSLALPRSATEIKPLSSGHSPQKARQPQSHYADKIGHFTLGADWYPHREQVATMPPSFENTAVYAF